MDPNTPIFPDALDVNIAEISKGDVVEALELGDAAHADIGTDPDDVAPGDHTHPALATNSALAAESSARIAGDNALDAAKAPVAHTHSQLDITGLAASLGNKSDVSHTHAAATTSVAGFQSAVDKLKLDNLKVVYTTRAQTDANGNYTWTYPAAFATPPRILVVAETASGTTDVVNAQVNGAPTTTQCVIKVNRTQPAFLAVLGLNISAFPASIGQQWVHIAAYTP